MLFGGDGWLLLRNSFLLNKFNKSLLKKPLCYTTPLIKYSELVFLSLLKTMGDGLMCLSYLINSQIRDIKVSKYLFLKIMELCCLAKAQQATEECTKEFVFQLLYIYIFLSCSLFIVIYLRQYNAQTDVEVLTLGPTQKCLDVYSISVVT